MNFKDCIDSYPFILMEGALGERLKGSLIWISVVLLQWLT